MRGVGGGLMLQRRPKLRALLLHGEGTGVDEGGGGRNSTLECFSKICTLATCVRLVAGEENVSLPLQKRIQWVRARPIPIPPGGRRGVGGQVHNVAGAARYSPTPPVTGFGLWYARLSRSLLDL